MSDLVAPLKQVKIEEPKATGLVAFAAKKPRGTRGDRVTIETNIRKIDVSPNHPVHKYAVQVNYVFTDKEGKEKTIEMSKSEKKSIEHDNDKQRCQLVYRKAVEKYAELRTGGPYFYDRQASLYTLTKLKNENIAFEIFEGVSKRPNFVKAQFVLKKVDESFQTTSNDIGKTVNACPALADKTFLEAMNIIVSAPAFENKNVITTGSCVHYLIDTHGINVPYKEYPEGMRYSGTGASKSVKTLEGTGKTPSLYMTAEMKQTLFHPDYANLVELMTTFRGFETSLKSNTPAANRIEKAFVGLFAYLNVGEHKGLHEDGYPLKIRKFANTSNETRFTCPEYGDVSVTEYFKKKYNYKVQYPNLFTIETKGRKGAKAHFPVEVLILCPSQTVTNDQMINNEQADMIRMSAAFPNVRKATTDTVVKAVGLASNDIHGFIKVDNPLKLEGIVLNKPKITFAGGSVAGLTKESNPRAKFPTDFQKTGKYYEAKDLSNWQIIFVQGDELKGVDEQLMNEMRNNGMSVTKPDFGSIVRGDVESIFKKAKQADRKLLFFVIKTKYNYHQQIKMLEQKYDVLTQEIHFETAEKMFRQPQTRLNIVNKTNMKLGGLNYLITSEALGSARGANTLIIGFETSQRTGGNPDYPISVGFAANMLDDPLKFAGGYVYVKREKDIFGSILKDTVTKILLAAAKNRKKETVTGRKLGDINYVLVYFNGVSEGQYATINEIFSEKIKQGWVASKLPGRPHITIIAASKTHNERLYKSGAKIDNLDPGTVIDHTIVSPVYSEWYLASAVSRQGTTKTTKFTVIFTTAAGEPLGNLEEITNDLCYDHQIVFHPVGLPVPLFIAGRYSQRGAMVLNANNGPLYDKDTGSIDLAQTNDAYGYSSKKLFNCRFNA